jgi:tetratricopeptide (TPR) repeat protein
MGDWDSAFDVLFDAAQRRRYEGDMHRARALLILCEEALDPRGVSARNPRQRRLWAKRAHVAAELLEFDEAENFAKRCLQAGETETDPMLRAEARMRLGQVARFRGGFSAAERELAAAEAELARAGETDPYLTARIEAEKGEIATQRGNFEKAETAFSRAQALWQRSAFDREAIWARHRLGVLALKLGKLEEAEGKLLEVREEMNALGLLKYLATVISDLGEVARLRGDLGTAEERYREAFSMHSFLRDPGAAYPAANLGFLLIAAERFPEARDTLLRCLPEFKRVAEWHIPAIQAGLLVCAAALGDGQAVETWWAGIASAHHRQEILDIDVAQHLELAGDLLLPWHPERAKDVYAGARLQWGALGRPDRVARISQVLADS